MGSLSNARFIVGLGNPGRRYARTRHNVGFLLLDELANRWTIDSERNAFGGVLGETRVSASEPDQPDVRVFLLKPQTFMNCSGQAVKGLIEFYKADLQNLLVVLDDIALPVGRIRIRKDGSAGGQKGLADVQRLLGTNDVPRLRIGVGSPPPQMDAADYVLRPFEDDETETVRKTLSLGADAVQDWLNRPIEEVMSKYNGINLERKVEDE